MWRKIQSELLIHRAREVICNWSALKQPISRDASYWKSACWFAKDMSMKHSHLKGSSSIVCILAVEGSRIRVSKSVIAKIASLSWCHCSHLSFMKFYASIPIVELPGFFLYPGLIWSFQCPLYFHLVLKWVYVFYHLIWVYLVSFCQLDINMNISGKTEIPSSRLAWRRDETVGNFID